MVELTALTAVWASRVVVTVTHQVASCSTARAASSVAVTEATARHLHVGDGVEVAVYSIRIRCKDGITERVEAVEPEL